MIPADPPSITGDSPEAVAYALMHRIADRERLVADAPDQSTREYWLELYRTCWMTVMKGSLPGPVPKAPTP